MKKIISILIIFCFCLSIISCEVISDNSSTEKKKNTLLSESDALTEAELNTDENHDAKSEEAITEGQSENISDVETQKATEETESVETTESERITESEETVEDETEEYVSPYLAPDFTVYDLEGNEVKLSDYRGRPIVLNFWARDCIYCTMEMADFQEAYEKYGAKVEFLMVCFTSFSGKGIEYEQEYITENGYTFPVYFDVKNSAVSKYGINSIPQTFFINGDFDLYTYIPGMASADSLETCIGYILE